MSWTTAVFLNALFQLLPCHFLFVYWCSFKNKGNQEVLKAEYDCNNPTTDQDGAAGTQRFQHYTACFLFTPNKRPSQGAQILF